MKRWLWTGALVVIAAGAWLYFTRSSAQDTADLLVSPQKGPFEITVTATGELLAKNSVDIRAPSEIRDVGIYRVTIESLLEEGTVVEKGQVVATLDKTELADKISEARDALDKAEAQYTQTKLDCTLTLSQERETIVNLRYALEESKLNVEQSRYEAPAIIRQYEIAFEKGKRQLDKALENYETRVEKAAAEMKAAESDLNNARRSLARRMDIVKAFTITAPEKGMLIYRRTYSGKKVTEGDQVSAWNPTVATLPDLSLMESIAYINEIDIQKIKEGQKVRVGLDADPDKKLTGEITYIANIGEQRPNSDAKVFEVRVTINESDTTLRPAMTTSNNILVQKFPDKLFIPLEAVFNDDSVAYVFRKKDVGAERQVVELGEMNENAVVVKRGLSSADQIFLAPPADTAGLPLRPLP